MSEHIEPSTRFEGADASSPPARCILITGATSGIGAAYADQLAALGHDLWLTGRRRAVLEEVASAIREQHRVTVYTEIVDLADTEALNALTKSVADHDGVDGLINNAGYADDGIFHLMTSQQHLAQMQVHMSAAVLLARAAMSSLEAHRGFLINVASLASWMPTPGSPLYGPTKGFLRLFTETLALTYHDTGIRFQALCPGFVVTDFHSRMGLDPDQFYHRRGPAKAFPAEWVVRRSLRDLNNRRVICSPGLHYRFLSAVIRFTPRLLLYRLLRMGMSQRYSIKQ